MLSLHIFQNHSTKTIRHLNFSILLSCSSNWTCLGKNASFPDLVYSSLTWLPVKRAVCKEHVPRISIRTVTKNICAETNIAASALRYLVRVVPALLLFRAVYILDCVTAVFPNCYFQVFWAWNFLWVDMWWNCLKAVWCLYYSWMLWVNFQFKIRFLKDTLIHFISCHLKVFHFITTILRKERSW